MIHGPAKAMVRVTAMAMTMRQMRNGQMVMARVGGVVWFELLEGLGQVLSIPVSLQADLPWV